MSDDAKKVRWTRRSALGLMAAGGGLVGLNTFGFSQSSGLRGTMLGVDGDEEALLGLLVGQSSLSILNNFGQDIEVDVELPNDVEIVGEGDTLAFPVEIEGVEDNGDEIVSTVDLVFEQSSGVAGEPEEFEFTVTATGFGGSISRTLEIEVLPPDEIGEDPEPDDGDNPATVLVEPDDDDVLATHTWSVLAVDASDIDFPVKEIELDYTEVDPDDSFAEADIRTASVSVIDTNGNPAGVRINRGQSDFPRDDENRAMLFLQNELNFGDIDTPADVIAVAADVRNPDSDGIYNPEITFRDEQDDESVTFVGEFIIGEVNVEVTAEKKSIDAGENNDITATVDVGGDQWEDQNVRFSVISGEGSLDSGYVIRTTDENGEAEITYESDENEGGEVEIEAEVRGVTGSTTFDVNEPNNENNEDGDEEVGDDESDDS